MHEISVTLPVNKGYIVTPQTPTMCIHHVQLAPPGHEQYKPCPHCFALVYGAGSVSASGDS